MTRRDVVLEESVERTDWSTAFEMISNRLAPSVLLILIIACDRGMSAGGGRSVAERETRDSAGVRVVENGNVRPGEWRVSSSALFTLGWGTGEPTFTWIQSGQVLSDGGALVGDFGSGSIYRIGHDGSVVASWGRKGEGPGEYQGLDAMLLRGDSVFVSDGRLLRVTILSLEGVVYATRPLPGAFLHQVSTILADGRLLLIPGDGYSAISETRPEWVFERKPILAVSLHAASVDTLAELPHLRRWYGTRGASPGPIPVKGRAAGFADGFAWSRSDGPEVRWYDRTGRLVQIARWTEEPVPLTQEGRRRMATRLEDALRGRGDATFVATQLAELEQGFDRHAGPLPYWDSFHVDRQGNAWLREYSLPGEPSSRWRVLARDGTLAGVIELPDVTSILDITHDRILAVRLNELDVPAVVMLPLFKS